MRFETNAQGVSTKIKIASLPKNRLEITSDIKQLLSTEELRDLETVIDVYQQAHVAMVRAAVLRFPQTAREVVEYISRENVEPIQRRLIKMSLVDSLWRIRKLEREDSELDPGFGPG